MPILDLPPNPVPPQEPPAIVKSVDNSNTNKNKFKPTNTVTSTGNTSNSTQESNSKQKQNSEATAVNNGFVSPNITGQSYSSNSNTQVNTGYGENTQQCLENVGCESTPHLSFTGYYNRSTLDSNSLGISDFDSNHNNYGFAARFIIPFGDGFGGNLNKIADEERIKRELENVQARQEIVAKNLATDIEALNTCVKLRNSSGGKVVYVDPNGNELARRIHSMCDGIGINLAAAPTDDQIQMENQRLREKIDQLMRTGVIEKVGN